MNDSEMETNILENKLIETRNILIDLEKLKTDIRFISDKEKDYFKNIVENSSFFYRVYRNSIKLFVIDICKLLDPKEHFSLIKTIDYIISNRKRIDWKREMKIEKLKIFKEKIEGFNLKELENFRTLRNKHYAHNDNKKYEFESKVTLSNCWKSLILIQEIFIELNLNLLNEQFIFKLYREEPREIVSLSKYKEITKYVLSELKKGPDIGNLQKVRDISIRQ